MANGYYQMARGWMDHPFFKNEKKFSQRDVWIWMIEQTTWSREGRVINILEKPYHLSRGQFSHSIRFMMKAWGWKKSAVETFIKKLRIWGMIRTDKQTGQFVITICNYDTYQAPSDSWPDSKPDKGRTDAGQNSDKKEERKECKEREERKDIYSVDFESFWKGWIPFDMDKGSKAQAKKFYKKARKEINHETIIAKRDQYLADCHSNRRRTTHASTWINPTGRRGWADDYTNSTVNPSGSQPAPSHGRSADGKLYDRVNATARQIDDLIGD